MRYLYLIIFFVLWSISKLYGQYSLNFIKDNISEKIKNYPPELVYIQPSKGIYETGEDLWFKVYQLDSQTMGFSDKSRTLYLQLISSKDSVVWQEKYPVEEGIASGHIYVDEKLPEGDYYLESYTKYSFYENDSEGVAPRRKIKIVKNISNHVIEEALQDTTFRFEMFPESGNLVSGIRTNLAFKATDGKGNPVHMEGTLYQNGEPISAIKSSHDGMGTISFIPCQEKKYNIGLTNGRNYTLPDIYSEGMVLRLSDRNEHQLDFIVSQKSALPNQTIYLLGQMRGMICCVARGILKDSLQITIPLNNFTYQGIAEFTLLNGALEPVAERLVYIHPDKKLNITVEPEKRNYAIREKATIKFKVTDEKGNPVRANLGISVYDKAFSNLSDETNMLAYSYLSSQIRGGIHNPAYYFDENNSERMDELDLLLLTQGWRRYIWNWTGPTYNGQNFLNDEINGIQTFKSKKKQDQHQGTEQLIQVSGAEGNAQFVWADSNGRFTVSPDILKELRGGYIYLKPMLSKEFKPILEIEDFFSVINLEKKNRKGYYPIIDLSKYRDAVAFDLPVISSDSTILLDEVVVTRKAIKPFRDKFMGRLDSLAQMNTGDVYVCGCGYLQNYRPDYDAHPPWKPCHVSSDKRTKPIEGKQYVILKVEHLGGNAFSVVDRQTVIYRGPAYSDEDLLHMNNLWRTKGYYAAREFYQPDEIDMQLSVPDARNTLLWKPTVITDEKGEATVSFFCSDINTGFIGIVEGVDGMGLLGTAKCEFRVMRK